MGGGGGGGGGSTRSDTNRTGQLYKMARDLKFQI